MNQLEIYTQNTMQEATYISITANDHRAKQLGRFLKEGASLVGSTEPNTKLWLALNQGNNNFAIFDVFPDEHGRAEHFGGQVAAALKEKSLTLVAGGWEGGVVNNVKNYQILSSKLPTNHTQATEATYITLTAKEGKAQELANLLSMGGDIVAATEPGTVFWFGMQLDERRFAIFDTFINDAARQAHFNGKVAAALQAKAEEIVEGGWEEGVLKNIRNYTIVAETAKQ